MINKAILKRQRGSNVSVRGRAGAQAPCAEPATAVAHQSQCLQGGQGSSLAQLQSASHSICL